MFISSFIGSIFVLFSLVVLFKHGFYQRFGRKSMGRVVAIERYQNQSRHKSRTRTTIYYRPIVEFDYNGDTHLIAGSGEATIRYIIGEKVELLTLKHGPEFCLMADGRHYIFGYLFFLVGLGGIGVASMSSWMECLLPPVLLISALLIGISFLKRQGKLQMIFEGLLRSKLESREKLEGREVLWAMSEVEKIRSKHTRSGRIVSLVFFSLSTYAAYYCWSYITPSGQQSLLAVLQLQAPLEALKPFIEEQVLVAFLITSFFSLISLMGGIFPARK